MDEINELLGRFYSAWRANDAAYGAWAGRYGLSLTELLILYSFWEEDGESRTQAEICRKWTMPKQTVNSALKELGRRGYVTLTPSERDRRAKAAALTEPGREFASKVIGELRAVEKRACAALGAESLRAMTEAVERYAELFRAGAGEGA